MQSVIDRIEKLDSKHHKLIGAILKKDPSIKFNESQGGVMINASTISEEVFEEVRKFLMYLDDQENTLYKIEHEKEKMKQDYFEWVK